MTKFTVFSRQNLMIAVNLFSLMCTIALTMPQFLHVVYDISVYGAPGRFSSHHCQNHWSILCLNSKKKKKKKKSSAPPHFQICVEGKQTIFFGLTMDMKDVIYAVKYQIKIWCECTSMILGWFSLYVMTRSIHVFSYIFCAVNLL